MGNTEEVCRSSYVHPAVLRAFERDDVVKHAVARQEVVIEQAGTGLNRSERALLDLLERWGRRRNAAAPAGAP